MGSKGFYAIGWGRNYCAKYWTRTVVKGFVIAAGRGIRMGPMTEEKPKCLVTIAGRPLLEHTVGNLRSIGCDDIVIVTGYKRHLINLPMTKTVENSDFLSNNILHSLMHARAHMEGDIVVSYSDIWVEPEIFSRLLETPGDIAIATDTDWQPYYEGRTDHPISEAENVRVDINGRIEQIGKGIDPAAQESGTLGEFLGLWRMSARGTELFRSTFLELESRLGPDDDFQGAASWRQAYVTDLFQELVDNGCEINCALVERGWAEIDTRQDFDRLRQIAGRQRLKTIETFDGALW
jgi:choline kinase